MRQFIIDFYGYAVFFYSLALIINYMMLMVLSFLSQRKEKILFDVPYIKNMLTSSPYTPGVSIIAPAYNEEVTIIDNVNSMLSLDYPKMEVVIVNDGSTDSTLDKLITNFQLVEVPFAYRELVKSRPVKRVLKSTNPKYYQLIVVDKINGGTKADASNAGINVAQYPYFISTDVDCIVEQSTLYRLVWPVLSNHTRVIGVSATMLMANGCRIKNGLLIKARMPHTPLPLFQQLEYMRSYLVGKMGWSVMNALPNISGGFGFFDKEIVVAAGGYDSKSFAEDMDLLVRMVKYMCETHKKYKVIQIPETCCWTEGPPTLTVLYRQRTRWARGLLQYFMIHRKVLFNPRYRQMGLITTPFLLVFEFMAPIIEFTGLIVFVWLALTNAINWTTMWIIFLMIYVFSFFLTIVVCLFDYFIGASYWRSIKRGYPLLLLASMIEPFTYHPLIMIFSIIGYVTQLLKREYKWGKMTRTGFKDEKNPDNNPQPVLDSVDINTIPVKTVGITNINDNI